jgi:hypothetical protein
MSGESYLSDVQSIIEDEECILLVNAKEEAFSLGYKPGEVTEVIRGLKDSDFLCTRCFPLGHKELKYYTYKYLDKKKGILIYITLKISDDFKKVVVKRLESNDRILGS